ncbi:MAG TPA: hypothetical protein VI456_05695 [Polyangia bacterium]
MTLTSTGGGLEAVPAGAACDPAVYVYTVDFTAQSLAANTCTLNGDWSDPANYAASAVVVPLGPNQWASVQAAVAAVTVSDGNGCGADAPSRNLVVAKSSASITYGDDFYICLKQYSQYVSYDDLYQLETTLSAIP